MSYILVSATGVFIITHEEKEYLENLIQSWQERTTGIITGNADLYLKCFRESLEVPSSLTKDEEKNVIHAKYGPQPYENQDFQSKVKEAVVKYNKTKQRIPLLRRYLEDHNCRVTEWKKVIYDL